MLGRIKQTGEKFHRISGKPCVDRAFQQFFVRNFCPSPALFFANGKHWLADTRPAQDFKQNRKKAVVTSAVLLGGNATPGARLLLPSPLASAQRGASASSARSSGLSAVPLSALSGIIHTWVAPALQKFPFSADLSDSPRFIA